MKIDIPNLNSNNTLRFTKELQNTKKDQYYAFNFTKMTNFDPFGMLLCSSSIRKFREERKDSTFKIQYHNDSNVQYAGHMGFFKSFSPTLFIGKAPGEAHGNNNYLPITKINFSEFTELAKQKKLPIGQIIENKASQLAKILSRNNDDLFRLLTYIIRETIRNSQEHSHSDCVWICAQYWESMHFAEIAILDEGIGIKSSLIKNVHYKDLILDDRSALYWSLKPGITEAFKIKNMKDDIWDNSGFGLYMASHLCPALGGMFLIASGNSALINTFDEKTVEKTTSHNGTAIKMSINTDKIHNYDKLRSEILVNGEAEAKKIRKAAKKASFSSKGLIDYLN